MTQQKGKRGTLFVITGPSRVGKTSIAKGVLKTLPELGIGTTYTTREARKSGHEDKIMFNISREEFELKAKNGDFLEWNEHHGELYGTSAKEIYSQIDSGKPVFLNIDVKGAHEIIKIFPEAVTIGIMPDHRDVLMRRQEERKDHSEEAKQRRIDDIDFEIGETKKFRHIIVNETGRLDETIDTVVRIIEQACGKPQ